VVAQRSSRVSFAVGFVGLGVWSYAIIVYLICNSNIGDERLYSEYAEVPKEAYQVPMVAFSTAFGLNFLTLMFERESIKFQLALIACYINLLAASSDFIAWQGWGPIVKDSWGVGSPIVRMVMWLWTTPAMVYLLSIISDYTRTQVYMALGCDVLMILTGMAGTLMQDRLLSGVAITMCVFFFQQLIKTLWGMFRASLQESQNDAGKLSLKILRAFTVGLWFSFPTIWFVAHILPIPLVTEEWMWTCFDFMGKVMFSSSLLQGNFLTIEQRRLITMRIVEEGNRIKVIHELKELVEQKERFMSSMSHELRTPLNGIIGLSDALIIGSCGEVNDKVLKTISTIKTSGSRLLNLVNDILDAASMRKGKLAVKHEKVNLYKIVEDVVELTGPLTKRGVKLVVQVPGNIPYVLGDMGRIIQIFHNLIGNACKFTHNGQICIGATRKGKDEVDVFVRDTGIGIPEDKFEQIFQAFEQVDMSTTRKYGGTGLGLNLVQKLVEAHGGTVRVHSKMGEGTVFCFNLKVYNDEEHNAMKNHEKAQASSAAEEVSASQQVTVVTADKEEPKGKSLLHKRHRHGVSRAVSCASLASRFATAAPTRSSNQVSPDQDNDAGRETGIKARRHSTQVAALGRKSTASRFGCDTDDDDAISAEEGGTASVRRAATEDHLARTPTSTDGNSLAQQRARARSFHENAVSHAPSSSNLSSMQMASKAAAARSSIDQAKRMTGQGEQAQFSEAVSAKLEGDTKGISSKPSAGPVRVLSVDDDPINQLVIQNLLVPEGFEIFQAMDGQEALDMLEDMDAPPDIILLDVMMPGMSGYEVCRELQARYPLACIPVIMISAKSNEENIVEGLNSGSVDYVVKPFGRQEIIARINAHLRFRSAVMDLAEVEAAENLAAQRGVSKELLRIAKVESKHFSLPFNIKSQVENSNGMPSMLKMFDQLTMVIIGIANFDALSSAMVPEELALVLALLHARLDDLLLQHGCYLVDNGEGRILVVTGLSREDPQQQVQSALALCQNLLDYAENTSFDSLDAPPKFELSMGIHTTAAQGLISGVNHPVMHFTGLLPDRAAQLEATCPPACIHVSKRVMECSGSPNDFVVAVTPGKSASKGDCSYLHKSGNWKSQHTLLPALVERYAASHPFGPFNSVATQLRPIQQALMLLLRRQPELVVEFVSGCSNIRPLRAGGPRSPLQAASPWSQNAGNFQSQQQQPQQQQQQLQGAWAGSTGSLSSLANPRLSAGKRASAQGDGTSSWVAGGSRSSLGGPRSGVGAGARSEMMHLESQMNPQKRQSLTMGTKQHSTEEAWGLPLASGVISRSSVSMDASMRPQGEHASGKGHGSLGRAHSEGGRASVCGSDRGGVTTQGNGLDAASFAELQHDKDLVEQQLEEVSNEASRLQDIVDCLEAEVLAQSDLRTRLEESQAQMEELSTQRARLQAEIEEANAQAAHLQAQVEEMGGHNEQLAAALDTCMAQKEALAAQLAGSDKERERLATYLGTAVPPPASAPGTFPPSFPHPSASDHLHRGAPNAGMPTVAHKGALLNEHSGSGGEQMEISRGPAAGVWLPTPTFQVTQLPQAPAPRNSMEQQLADVQNAQRVTESQLAAAETALFELRHQYLVDSSHAASLQHRGRPDPAAATAAAAVAAAAVASMQGEEGGVRYGSGVHGIAEEGEGDAEQQRQQARAAEASMHLQHGPFASGLPNSASYGALGHAYTLPSLPLHTHPRTSGPGGSSAGGMDTPHAAAYAAGEAVRSRRRAPPRPQASEPNLSHLIHPRYIQHQHQQRTHGGSFSGPILPPGPHQTTNWEMLRTAGSVTSPAAGSHNSMASDTLLDRPSSRSSVQLYHSSDAHSPPGGASVHTLSPSQLDSMAHHAHPRDLYAAHLPQGPVCLYPGSGASHASQGGMSAAAATSALLARSAHAHPSPPMHQPQQFAAAARLSQHQQLQHHQRTLLASMPNTPLGGAGNSMGSAARSPPSRSSSRLSLMQPQAQHYHGGAASEGLGAGGTHTARQSSSNLSVGDGSNTGMMGILANAGLAHLLPNFDAQEVCEPGMLRCMDDATLESLGVNTVGARLRLRLVAAAADEAGHH